jgi:hypothetical protein
MVVSMRHVALGLLAAFCWLNTAGCRGCDDDDPAGAGVGANGAAGTGGTGGTAGATGGGGTAGSAGTTGGGGTPGGAGTTGAAGTDGGAGTTGAAGTGGGAGAGGAGGSGGAGGAGGTFGGQAPTRDAFIAHFCDLYRPCCAAMGRPADGQACRAYFALYWADHLAPTYDQGGGETCLAGLAPASSQPGFCTNALLRTSVCEVALGISGIRTVGQPCTRTAECVVTSFCDLSRSLCAPRLPLIAPCTGIADECEKGTYCDVSSGLCRNLLPVGDTCAASGECVTNICASFSGMFSRCVNPPDTLGVSILCGGG